MTRISCVLCLTLLTLLGGGASAQAGEYTAEHPLVLTMSTAFMPTHGVAKYGFFPWMEEIKRKSGGRVVIEYYNPNTICPDAETYDCVKNGIMDLGSHSTQRVKGKFPLSNVMDMPFLYADAEAATRAYGDLLREFPAMAEEFKETKLLAMWSSVPYQLHSSKKIIHTIADLKGLKIGCINPVTIPILDAMGSAAMGIPTTEAYVAIQRGQVDFVCSPFAYMVSTKTYEAARNSFTVNLCNNSIYLIMNKQRWNSLPADIRNIFEETAGMPLSLAFGRATDKGGAEDIQTMLAHGQNITALPPDEIAKGQALAASVVDDWLKECARRGLGDVAKAAYARSVELAARYNAESAAR